ncbi:hypothetical protein EC396_09195 [Lutibacter sp. HS1-25]|uniref:hypothetical protein n=1 Tax=Lutibacter sp. HS1-25 TaxID=2485000 RepID=UPI001010D23E|nr:hypothetical protein [Lutibacter sp. HS1-25]RXP54547.1 hypothetical protein EC396_09195 [Lutibacter sp. HS1-25]
MEKNKIIPAKIHPFKIEIIDSYINDAITDNDADFDFNVAHKVQHNLEDERIKIQLLINLLLKTDATIGVKFNIDFHYKITDLKDHYENDANNRPIFSGLFIATILGISFSTARGILFGKLSETKLNNLILPVIDPVKMLATNNQKPTP